MNSGIYLITNLSNGKVYVGSSDQLKRRKYLHFYRLKRGNHANPHLQNAWNHYGEHVFTFQVIEYVLPVKEILEAREAWWVKYYFDSISPDKGYNLVMPDRTEMS